MTLKEALGKIRVKRGGVAGIKRFEFQTLKFEFLFQETDMEHHPDFPYVIKLRHEANKVGWGKLLLKPEHVETRGKSTWRWRRDNTWRLSPLGKAFVENAFKKVVNLGFVF